MKIDWNKDYRMPKICEVVAGYLVSLPLLFMFVLGIHELEANLVKGLQYLFTAVFIQLFINSDYPYVHNKKKSNEECQNGNDVYNNSL